MKIDIETQPLPLHVDENGVVRIGKTRVTLDSVVEAFLDGATAEEIAQQYPSLSLPDVYSAIAYYLQRPKSVNTYIAERKRIAQKIKEKNEIRFNPLGIRARLVARRKKKIEK